MFSDPEHGTPGVYSLSASKRFSRCYNKLGRDIRCEQKRWIRCLCLNSHQLFSHTERRKFWILTDIYVCTQTKVTWENLLSKQNLVWSFESLDLLINQSRNKPKIQSKPNQMIKNVHLSGSDLTNSNQVNEILKSFGCLWGSVVSQQRHLLVNTCSRTTSTD